MSTRAPILYLPHGGGPMPLMGDPAQAHLGAFLKTLGQRFPAPDAIVLVSAHWEESHPSVYADERPGMLFDYYGFPPETYRFSWPAPGSPALASRIAALLQQCGIECRQVQGRGYDHGTFVPMLLMYPVASIPCIQLSLVAGLDPLQHLRLGECLQELREQNIAIIGSGMSFHNLRAIFAGEQPEYRKASDQFADWLVRTMSDASLSTMQRLDALAQWQQAPYASFCHPRAEHLLPLHVCAGAAGGMAAEVIFNEPLLGHRVSGFGWF
jgi:4,5-DOPA dioxygenase extradiol